MQFFFQAVRGLEKKSASIGRRLSVFSSKSFFFVLEVPSVTDDNKDEILVDKEAGKKSKNLQLHNHTTLLTNPSNFFSNFSYISLNKQVCHNLRLI